MVITVVLPVILLSLSVSIDVKGRSSLVVSVLLTILLLGSTVSTPTVTVSRDCLAVVFLLVLLGPVGLTVAVSRSCLIAVVVPSALPGKLMSTVLVDRDVVGANEANGCVTFEDLSCHDWRRIRVSIIGNLLVVAVVLSLFSPGCLGSIVVPVDGDVILIGGIVLVVAFAVCNSVVSAAVDRNVITVIDGGSIVVMVNGSVLFESIVRVVNRVRALGVSNTGDISPFLSPFGAVGTAASGT